METILILQSMYPLPDELVLSPDLALALEDPTSTSTPALALGEKSVVLRIPLLDEPGQEEKGPTSEDRVGFRINFPPKLLGGASASASASASSRMKITYAELPDGLIRADVDMLERKLGSAQNDFRSHEGGDAPQDEEEEDEIGLITHVIEIVRPRILDTLLSRRAESALSTTHPNTHPTSRPHPDPSTSEPLERYYLWFPSLSTPAKRKDLVTYASRYDLTGFVLAGKPGLLCLEGRAGGVQAYLGDIKNESWGDIPSYQKKVTERTRHPIPSRAFDKMQEITHLIDQRGVHGNRGDMRQVKEWMEGNGVGDEFGFVMGQ